MSTKFQPIQIPPGVVAQPTKNMRSSNWAEVNLMRWIEGELQPVGGQQIYAYAFASRCKAIHGWYGLDGVYRIAYVCEQHVYVDTSGALVDITPAGGWPPPPLPSQGGYGDLDYSDDDYGTPRSSGQILSINKVPNVWSVDNFGAILLVMNSVDGRLLEWDPSANGAAVSAYTGWGTTQNSIQMATLNPGSVVAGMRVTNQTTGLLVGTVESWDSPTLFLTANALSPGSANDVLLFDTLLTPTTSPDTGTGFAPKGRSFVVTPERFVMIFAMYADGTPAPDGLGRRFGWCDQEDRNAWNFSSVTSQAGFLDIEPASPIITAISGKFGTLIWTAKKVYVSRYLGLPYIYNYVEMGDETTPWSPASVTTTSAYVLWMAASGCWSFDGTTVAPVACAVRTWITDNHDAANVREEACAVGLNDFNEFWWFFPENGQLYNTRCVIYNYKEGWWSQGRMSRSAGITSSYTVQPIMADGTQAFQHELGPVYANADPPWAETFDLNLASGARLVTLKQVIPDIKGDMPNVQFSFFTMMSRSLPGVAVAGKWSTPVPIRPDGYVDARVTGRAMRMKISMVGPRIMPFTVGQHLVDFAIRGDR